jgi:hypothetical protein
MRQINDRRVGVRYRKVAYLQNAVCNKAYYRIPRIVDRKWIYPHFGRPRILFVRFERRFCIHIRTFRRSWRMSISSFMPPLRPTRRMPLGHRSQSEADWADAKRALACGDVGEEVIRKIADYRADDKAGVSVKLHRMLLCSAPCATPVRTRDRPRGGSAGRHS